jgi:capsular polysaccharide biosynthesis protein
MAESLDIVCYISYLRSRWAWIAGSGAVAVALALGVSLALPRQYTASARIVIEPPAAADPRAIVAESPVYLESLKTYEQFASSDSLFQKAIDRFQLRTSGAESIESLKKRVLKVEIVRTTRILEIAVTLPDARRAQQVVEWLAESSVDMSRSLATAEDEDIQHGMVQQASEARVHLDAVQAAWARLVSQEPVDDLQSSISQSADLRSALEQQLYSVEQEIAEAAERQKTPDAADASEARKEAVNAAARREEIRKQLQALAAETKDREQVLALRTTHRDRLGTDLKTAQDSLIAIESRLREARANSPYRAERLQVVDPGVVPERPSSPNVPLNIVAALLLGLLLPVLYLVLEMNYRERSVTALRGVYQRGGR